MSRFVLEQMCGRVVMVPEQLWADPLAAGPGLAEGAGS